MSRLLSASLGLLIVPFVLVAGAGQEKPAKKGPQKKGLATYTNAADAGPDFRIQGEYAGKVPGKGDMGAQVVALGDGKFDVYFLTGGLPGAGWDTRDRIKVEARATEEGKEATLTDKSWSGTITNGQLTGKTADDATFTLERVQRQSPTLGAKPPAEALVLFDGTSVEAWDKGQLLEGNLLNCGTRTVKGLGAGKLHIEFMTPFRPAGRGQQRGNSGVYIQGAEVQVLDSFGLTGEKNECGAFYNRAKPAVNMCLPPLTWQTYDIEIKADEKERTVATVWHNGVKIHDSFVIRGTPPKPTPISLQNHGNPVRYRNIWFVATP